MVVVLVLVVVGGAVQVFADDGTDYDHGEGRRSRCGVSAM